MVRVRIESILAVLFMLGAIATLIWPTWIESLTGLEPDGGSGESEWWLVLLLGVAAVISGALAFRDKQRLAHVSATGS